MKYIALLFKFIITVVCAISGIDQFRSVHSNTVTLTLLYTYTFFVGGFIQMKKVDLCLCHIFTF